MKIEIEVQSIDYAELIQAVLPQIKELSDNAIIQGLAYVPPELVGKMVKHIPGNVLDKLAENIINKNQDTVKESIEEFVQQKGFHVKLKNISVKNEK